MGYSVKKTNFAVDLLDSVGELVESGLLADVTLVSDDGIATPAHRLILSASSSFLRELLLRDIMDQHLPSHLYLLGINHTELQTLLQFIYFGTTTVDHNRVTQLRAAAETLKIKEFESLDDIRWESTAFQETVFDPLADQEQKVRCARRKAKVSKLNEKHDWKSDDSLPPGWKSAHFQVNSFGVQAQSLRFLSPSGRYCSNRIDACRFMVSEGFSAEDIETMAGGLCSDGWQRDPLLPPGWSAKPRQDKPTTVYRYLSDKFQLFQSTKSAVKFLTESICSLEDIERLKAFSRDKSSDNEVMVTDSNVKLKIEADSEKEDISSQVAEVKNSCWKEPDPSLGLPVGWNVNPNKGFPMFLSPDRKVFRCRKTTLAHLKTSGRYSREEIRRFQLSAGPQSASRSEFSWNEADPSVPKGWRTTIAKHNSFGKHVSAKRFLSPDGKFCHSRREALRFMKENDVYDESEISEMATGLMSEGWETETLLPSGWLIRKSRNRRYPELSYLTENFKLLHSTRAAKLYIKCGKFGGKEDLARLETFLEQCRANSKSYRGS